MTADCYNKTVWNLQCKYGDMMYKYTLALRYGIACEDQNEKLTDFRRLLAILNRYDIRDVEGETTDYNVITFKTINCIIATLYKKY